MAVTQTNALSILHDLLKEKLKPFVKQVDAKGYYAEDYLKAIGESKLLHSGETPPAALLLNEVLLVEETAKYCMTTAFNLWCHLAALTYVRSSDNAYLKCEILPMLENGRRLGGTGLSNPMKYYAGLEKLHLKARRAQGGYIVSGNLGAVSNLGDDHWFGIIASVEDEQRRIMALVYCDTPGLTLKGKAKYIGLNGSATYCCQFEEVFIPDDWLLSEQADDYVKKVRPAFIAYQIPLALGVTNESIRTIRRVSHRQKGCNAFLKVQPDDLENEYHALREHFHRLIQSGEYQEWKKLLDIRLKAAYLALKAVQSCMLHQGGAAYLQHSDASRRLREAYFFANLTPTVKHLEKLLS